VSLKVPTTSPCATLGYSFPKRVRDRLLKRRRICGSGILLAFSFIPPRVEPFLLLSKEEYPETSGGGGLSLQRRSTPGLPGGRGGWAYFSSSFTALIWGETVSGLNQPGRFPNTFQVSACKCHRRSVSDRGTRVLTGAIRNTEQEIRK